MQSTSKRGSWSQALRTRRVWTRAAMIGLPVGCLQVVINQGDVWWHHQADLVVVAKTIASPFVAFSVAFVSAADAWVGRRDSAPAIESEKL